MLHILRLCFVFAVTGEVHEEAVKSIEKTTRRHHLLHQLILRVFVETYKKLKTLRHFLNNLSLTKLCPHVVKRVILLLNLFALHSVNDNLSLIVRSTNNKITFSCCLICSPLWNIHHILFYCPV